MIHCVLLVCNIDLSRDAIVFVGIPGDGGGWSISPQRGREKDKIMRLLNLGRLTMPKCFLRVQDVDRAQKKPAVAEFVI